MVHIAHLNNSSNKFDKKPPKLTIPNLGLKWKNLFWKKIGPFFKQTNVLSELHNHFLLKWDMAHFKYHGKIICICNRILTLACDTKPWYLTDNCIILLLTLGSVLR